MAENPSSRPTVATQLETLSAIEAYNKKLPKRRKLKDSLKECPTNNIAATFTVKRNQKKKTIELVTHYQQVGITDGCRPTSLSQDKFSLTNMQSEMQRSASSIKIRTLRSQYERLLTMDPPPAPLPGEEPAKTLEPSASVP